jgi:hypothetical protein
MVSVPLNKPLKRLLFRTPLPKGKGVKQALAWNREQLLDLRRLWELRRQRRISAGLLPMTQPPTMISDAVLDVENNVNTVTGIPPSFQIHPSTSRQPNLELQCQDLFQPTAWRGVNLNCVQATALAANLISALENNQDSSAIPPPYDYGEEIARILAEGLGLDQVVVAEGLGVRGRGGQRGGQGQGG